jgi:SAM-dependent methyltransferase
MLEKSLSLYQRSKDFLWTDKYISKQMLKFHLDLTNDAASRNEKTIVSTVNWINDIIPKKSSVIDLGCGPGLYTEKLSRMHHTVTGIDISKRAITYATKSAVRNKLTIQYYHQNYLQKLSHGKFEVAMCIYCDFGALTNEEQVIFLQNVSDNLCDNGILILDVFANNLSNTKKEEKKWDYCKSNGFFSNKPHYILYECKFFKDANAWGTRNVIIEKNKIKEFITWDTMYTEESIATLLMNNGFNLEEIRTDLVQKNEFTTNDVFFVKARKL